MTLFEFPESDTEMAFELAITNEEGHRIVQRKVLTGENAEYLPHILTQFNIFLKEMGFSVTLKVEDDTTGRIGPLVQTLLEMDIAA